MPASYARGYTPGGTALAIRERQATLSLAPRDYMGKKTQKSTSTQTKQNTQGEKKKRKEKQSCFNTPQKSSEMKFLILA